MRWRILSLVFVSRAGLGLQFLTVGFVGNTFVDAFDFN